MRISRPHVQINTPNLNLRFRQHLKEMLPHISAIDGLVGITLNGGLSRNYADHLSEIDITLYLQSETYLALQNTKAPLPVGITILNGQLYDIKYVDFSTERQRTWDAVALWDASYAEILYDPEERVRAMYDEQLKAAPAQHMAEGLMMACWWYFELAGEIWIHRGDLLQGHLMFNQAVISLVKALFVVNQEYIPHEKWLLHLSRSLEWRPENWEIRLQAAMSTGFFSTRSLRDRQEVVRGLWHEVDQQFIESCSPDLPVHMMQRTSFEQLKLLVEKGQMNVVDWRKTTGRDFPNEDPFHPIIRIEEGQIILDREKLKSVEPGDMYAWQFAVLQAVRKADQ